MIENYIWSYIITYDWSDKQKMYYKDLFKEDSVDGKANEWYIKNFNPNWYSTVTRQWNKPEVNSTHLFRFYYKS